MKHGGIEIGWWYWANVHIYLLILTGNQLSTLLSITSCRINLPGISRGINCQHHYRHRHHHLNHRQHHQHLLREDLTSIANIALSVMGPTRSTIALCLPPSWSRSWQREQRGGERRNKPGSWGLLLVWGSLSAFLPWQGPSFSCYQGSVPLDSNSKAGPGGGDYEKEGSCHNFSIQVSHRCD